MSDSAANVDKRNGAWRIYLFDPTGDLGPHEQVDCASRLDRAKQLAVEGAREVGFSGAIRWYDLHEDGQHWELRMTWDPEPEQHPIY